MLLTSERARLKRKLPADYVFQQVIAKAEAGSSGKSQTSGSGVESIMSAVSEKIEGAGHMRRRITDAIDRKNKALFGDFLNAIADNDIAKVRWHAISATRPELFETQGVEQSIAV